MTNRRPSKPLSGIHAKCCAVDLIGGRQVVCARSKGHDAPGRPAAYRRHYDPNSETYLPT